VEGEGGRGRDREDMEKEREGSTWILSGGGGPEFLVTPVRAAGNRSAACDGTACGRCQLSDKVCEIRQLQTITVVHGARQGALARQRTNQPASERPDVTSGKYRNCHRPRPSDMPHLDLVKLSDDVIRTRGTNTHAHTHV